MKTYSKYTPGTQHYLKGLFLNVIGNKKEIERTSNKIKKEYNIGIVSSALSQLLKSNSNFERLVHGYLSPSKIEELGKCNGYYFLPGSLQEEFLWVIMQIKPYKDKISLFNKIRIEVEQKFILGNYEGALDLLEKSVMELGLSVWYFEIKILLLSYLNRFNDLLNWISLVNESLKNAKTGYIPFILSYLYKRSLTNLSPIEFDIELYSRFKKNVTLFDIDKFNYFLFRLNFYQSYNQISDYAKMLLFESPNSAIDRYCNLLSVLKAEFTTNINTRNTVCDLALKLYRITKDERLLPFLAYSSREMPDSYYDSKFIEILDLYYIGEYKRVISLSKLYLKAKSSNFDVLKLYCRALLFLGKTYQKVIEGKDSPLDIIGNHMLHIMQGLNVKQNLDDLNKICKNLYGLSIGAGLNDFVREESTGIKNKSLKIISQPIYDPYFVNLFENDSDKDHYLKKGLIKIPDSIVIKYQKGRVDNIIDENSPVVPYIQEVDKGKILFKRKEFEECIDIMESVIIKNNQCVPVVQSAIEYVFNSYIHLEEDDKAISYFVDKYIKNHAFTKKIDSETFIIKLKKNKYKGIKYNLKFLIFVFENANEETDKSYVLEKFLNYKNVKDIIGLFEQFRYEDPLLVEEFLIHIIQDDILRHTTFIDSTKSILNQEHLILRYLIDLNTKNKNKYEEFLLHLTEEMIAYDGSIKEDESKIFANIPSIIKYELQSAKRLFSQFQTLYQTDGVCICMVDNTLPIENVILEENYAYLGQHVHFTDNALKEISFQLFSEIRYQFLKSKFGLGTYLSTRIRHGVFEGELRSIFSGNYLALNMENEVYQPILYWKKNYNLDEDFHISLIKALEVLSKKVDSIIKEFKSSILQIRLKEEENGFFDYILDDDAICLCTIGSYRKSHDFESFSQNIINYLLEVTERSLSNIRTRIKTNLMSDCLTLLDELERSVNNSGNINFDIDFKQVINDVRTQLTQRLLKIEGWFYFQDLKFEDYDFEKLTSLCWEITTKMHPNINCKLNLSIHK